MQKKSVLYIEAHEIMVPYSIASKLTYPMVVHPFNIKNITLRMKMGQVLFLQRGTNGSRMRSITHVAVQNYTPVEGDCLLRRGSKYTHLRMPLPTLEDIPLPIQTNGCFPVLCFGDRIRSKKDGILVDPLNTITWPTLNEGDIVLVTPQNGDWCLIFVSIVRISNHVIG